MPRALRPQFVVFRRLVPHPQPHRVSALAFRHDVLPEPIVTLSPATKPKSVTVTNWDWPRHFPQSLLWLMTADKVVQKAMLKELRKTKRDDLLEVADFIAKYCEAKAKQAAA